MDDSTLMAGGQQQPGPRGDFSQPWNQELAHNRQMLGKDSSQLWNQEMAHNRQILGKEGVGGLQPALEPGDGN